MVQWRSEALGSRFERRSPFRKAASVATLYFVICALYIVLSSRWAAEMTADPERIAAIEIAKGLGFVTVTSLVFFLVSYRRWKIIERQDRTIVSQEKRLVHTERKQGAELCAAATGHDLNNFLMSLQSLVDELKLMEPGHPTLADLRKRTEHGVERLSRLSRRMAAFAGRDGMDHQEMADLGRMLKDVVTLAQMHPDVRLSWLDVGPCPAARARLNPSLFETAVLNLIVNAAQAAGDGAHVRVDLAVADGTGILTVDDNGPGVPSSVRDSLFDPWFTTKPDGTGLGLVSVRMFSDSCGAEIRVGDSPLGGARFELRIPLQEAEKPPLPRASEPTSAIRP